MEAQDLNGGDIKSAIMSYMIEAQSILRNAAINDEDVIHDVRVLMKKARAALKLVQPVLDNPKTERLKTILRDSGRQLRLLRESSVLRRQLRKIQKKHPDLFKKLAGNERINLFLNKENLDEDGSQEVEEICRKVCSALRTEEFRLKFSSWQRLDQNLLEGEIKNTYSNLRSVYLLCRNAPRPSRLHEFRKRGKDFSYQLGFFIDQDPVFIKPLEKKLDRLTNLLGKYNDMTQLVKTLEYKYYDENNLPALDELVIIIREIQDSYLSELWPLAYKIFFPGKKSKQHSESGLYL